MESANAQAAGSAQPFFKSSDPSNTDTLSYSITYGGSSVTFTSGSAVVTDSNSRTPGVGTSNEIRVTYIGDFLYEDTYTDTLTFTITAK